MFHTMEKRDQVPKICMRIVFDVDVDTRFVHMYCRCVHLASYFGVTKVLHEAPTQKKKWYQLLQKDDLDEVYEKANVAKVPLGHRTPEMPIELMYISSES